MHAPRPNYRTAQRLSASLLNGSPPWNRTMILAFVALYPHPLNEGAENC